jgi:hypothetical protein
MIQFNLSLQIVNNANDKDVNNECMILKLNRYAKHSFENE